MTVPTPAAPVVRFKDHDPRDLLAFVRSTPTAPEVRVRIRRRGCTWRWVCDTCGRNTRPACAHVTATMAALLRIIGEKESL